MEQIKGQSLTLQTLNMSFTCLNNNQAINFCFDPNCSNSGIVCSNLSCKCIVGRHDDCSYLPIQRLIKTILNKKLTISNQLEKVFASIDQIYLQMIQKLSFDRQELALIKENYGLSVDQAKFLQLIKNRELDQIKGNIVYKIKSNVKETNDISGVNQILIKEYWQLQSKEFQKLTNKLKAIYTDKSYLRSTGFSWDKQSERQGFEINGLVAQKVGNHYNTNMVFLQPALSNEKKSFWGFHLKYSSGGLVSIGICNAQAYSSNKAFRFGANSVKSIAYQISSGGQTSQNGIALSNCFTFANNDSLYFLYDPYTSTLKISKNLEDGFYIMKNIDKSVNFSPYVSALQIGDSVQLINNIPEIDWNRPHTVASKIQTTFGNSQPQPVRATTSLFGGSANLFGQ